MNESRESFARMDATDIDGETLTFPVSDGSEVDAGNVTTHTVNFEDFDAETPEDLEAQLDIRAKEVLGESDSTAGGFVGYELVREEGETSRRVGFVVTE